MLTRGLVARMIGAAIVASIGLAVGAGTGASQGAPCPPEPNTCFTREGNCDVSDILNSDCTEISAEPGCESFTCEMTQT